MPYLPVKIKKGKNFKTYLESKEKMVASKAHVLQLALREALKDETHITEIDFIPGRFVLQLHGWISREEDPFKNCKKMQAFAMKEIKAGRDPLKMIEKKVGGKWHYDLRILKRSAPCFDDQTEVLTEEGWKLFSDLTKKNIVATLGENWNLIYKKPLGLFKQYYKGDVISCASRSFNMVVTPLHQCYFKILNCKRKGDFKKWHAYEIFGKKGQFTRKVNWTGHKENSDWFEFLGFWFAEGSARFGRLNGRCEINLSQRKENEFYVDNLLNRISFIMPKRWSKYRAKDGCIRWSYYNKLISKEFSQYGKSKDRKIPDFIRFADRKALRAFLKGFTIGDGSYREKRDWVLYSSSKILIDQLQELAIKAGYISNVRTHKISENRFSKNPIWKLCISVSEKRDRTVSEIIKKHWRWIPYKGFVYDVNMPNTIILVRRKGAYHWSYRTWFGQTFFSAPYSGIVKKKAMGTVKGLQVITAAGRKTTEWLAEQAEEKGVGIKEKQDRLFWMKVKCGYWPPGSTANPTRQEYAYMFLIDQGLCVVHRREADFTDISFLGTLLNGRYFNRLVERESKDEKGKKKIEINFYCWKAKKGQFPEDLIRKVAKSEIELSPLSAVKAAKGEELEKI